jgi:hypothetical protein
MENSKIKEILLLEKEFFSFKKPGAACEINRVKSSFPYVTDFFKDRIFI